MNVIDANWELRNLGISTQEVQINTEDSADEVISVLSSLQANYQVVKVPIARLDIYSALTELGFSFVEASIRVSHNFKEMFCPALIKRISDELSCTEMEENDVRKMEEQIQGGMFQTDRIILDKFFTPSQSANRYIFWMRDERQKGSVLYNFKYKGESVGFTCMRETKPDFYYPVLGGVYNTGKMLPFGGAILYKQLELIKGLGGKELYTYISSNNPSVVRVYSQLGYVFENISYVFVKHKS